MRHWKNTRVVVLGIARQGKALARFLTDEGASVVMSDIKTEGQLGPALSELSELGLTYVLGEHPIELLDDAEALFLSGGVPAQLPIVEAARQRNIPVLNDAQIFLEACPARVIGITGSAGKTTTTTLVHEMASLGLVETGRAVWLGGNIGRPLLDDLNRIKDVDVVVMELSSFQLELMTVSPSVAAVLNLTPDHLDRHASMAAYVEAKSQILASQSEEDIAVLGYDDPMTWALRDRAQGRVMAFGFNAPPQGDAAFVAQGNLVLRIGGELITVCGVGDLALRGPHNLLNVLAACLMSSTVGVPVGAMTQVARNFKGVPHRLEFVRTVGGVDWYNDSIATTPDRALAALHSFEGPLVIMLGGRDKDLDWEAFAREVVAKARLIILFGEARQKLEAIFRPLLGNRDKYTLYPAESFEVAFNLAQEIAQAGDVVLLSPGCTSYDEFANFEVRGERFKEMVRAL